MQKWGVVIYRGGVGLEGEFNVIAPSGSVEELCSALVGAGAQDMDTEAYEALRVGSGVPAHGPELGEEVNPLEAGLWDAVSFTKGCYVGQEVVARLNTYEKVKRYLAMLSLEDGPIPDAGTPLTVDGKDAGKLTSVSPITISGRRPALGYVRKAYANPEAALMVEAGDGPVACEFVRRVGTREEG